MASPNFSINPSLTTNAAGLFSVTENGLVQGVAMDDPAVRYALAGGYLNGTETLPMWGGVAIYENTPLATNDVSLGGAVGRSTSIATITGMSVFNQAHAGLTSPQSPVPTYATGMSINFYRLGSGARIAVAMDPVLVDADGQIITQQVSWDFTSQQLIQYSPAYAATTITGATWASTSGGQITYTVSSDLTSNLTAGDTINVSGIVSTGGTGVGYNGQFNVVSVTSTTVVVTFVAASTPGTYSSGGTIAAGGGAFPCRVLQTQVGGCKTVSYDAVNNYATWNPNGSAALILI